MERANCSACSHAIEPWDQTCQACGHPLPLKPGELAARCRVCGVEIGAYTETCPNCGEVGYPALRPRKGKGWKGSSNDK